MKIVSKMKTTSKIRQLQANYNFNGLVSCKSEEFVHQIAQEEAVLCILIVMSVERHSKFIINGGSKMLNT